MIFPSLALCLLRFSHLSLAAGNLIPWSFGELKAPKQENFATNRYLVQFKEKTSLRNRAPDDVTGFIEALKLHDIEAQVAYKYSPIIYNGVSIYLKSAQDAAVIQEMNDVSSIHQVLSTKNIKAKLNNATIARLDNMKTTDYVSTKAPFIAIQKSQYPYTAGSSSVTFTHAKKLALAAGLIQQDTPVYAYLWANVFCDRAHIYPELQAYVPVYETQGNSGDFKFDNLPENPIGEVTIVLTTANGKDSVMTLENSISTVGVITVLPVGQREPFQTSGEPWSVHHMTGVDTLHASGIRGSGIKIGMIDGGIDYYHPGLGGGFGPGFKVAGGYDIVGDSLRFDGQPWESDEDPQDVCSDSTSWAGVIFADDKYTGMVGVAPDANIYAYKTMTCAQNGGEDVTLAALQRAYDDDVVRRPSSIFCVRLITYGSSQDVLFVQASQHESPGGPNNLISQATSRLVDEGIFVAMASLNRGTSGGFYPSQASMGKNVAAVGSVEVDSLHATVAYASVDGKKELREIPYVEQFGLGADDRWGFPLAQKTPVIHLEGACDGKLAQFPPSTPKDLVNYTVIVPKDEYCLFDTITEALAPYKTKNIMVYDKTPGKSHVMPVRNNYHVLNVQSMSFEDGKYFADTLATGANMTLWYDWFPGIGVKNKNNARGLSDTTGWGPAYDGDLWPQIVAPGGTMFTTSHLNHYGYTNAAGTAAAQAYVTGIAALYYSQHGGKRGLGKKGAAALLQKMIATAHPIQWQDGTSTDINTPFKKRQVLDGVGLAPVAQQGGGLIDAISVLNMKSTVFPSYIKLGDKTDFESTWPVTITNPSTETVTYTIAHNASVTFVALSYEDLYRMRPHPGTATNNNKATVGFSESSFSITPGSSRTIEVKITAPPDGLPERGESSAFLPVFSGYIQISGTNGDKLNIPYQGISTDLRKEIPIWHPVLTEYPVASNFDYTKIITPPFPEEMWYFDMSINDNIIIYTFNTYATDELRVDVVTPLYNITTDWSYPPSKNYIESISVTSDYETSLNFPLQGVPRCQTSTLNYCWSGRLANGSTIANGEYKLVMSALLPKGDRSKKGHWQIKETWKFGVEIIN
ncbi:peptidase S8/S53 domain-containing protein [Bisporella sp. PMI_857]|nr:peptidase S8/S53 domain-containing protein [Bisporella sp. PMI_857]